MKGIRAQRPQKQETHRFKEMGMLLVVVLAACILASGQHWTPLPTFPGSGAGTAILTPVGDVLVEEITGPGGTATGNYYVLHPDVHGSYATGSWGGPATLPAGYGPQFFGSAVLPDGRVIIEGGEYNFGVQDDTTKGSLFDPISGVFSPLVTPPSGWGKMGDAPTVILPNGKFMIGDCCSTKEAILNASSLTWTSTGTGKADPNSEEGWTLLPNGKVLTVDTQNGTESELYDYTTGKWSLAGNTPSFLGNSCGMAIVPEMGPSVLRPGGTVFQAGANRKTAIYDVASSTWTAGPSFPVDFGVADGPASILPDGNVLVMASNIAPCFKPPARFYEFNGQGLIPAPSPPNAESETSYSSRMLVLPNGGHVLFTDGTKDVETYIPKGAPNSAWAPTLTSYPATITEGGIYTIKGTQFNGISQGAAYGDDAQSATNFPLVRLSIGGFTYYLPTEHFTMGVATGGTVVQAAFSLPFFVGTGSATLEVVANGIPSKAVGITVR
jgi:hypothetical protein